MVQPVIALQIALAFATAAALPLAIVPFLLKLAGAYGLYDVPECEDSAIVVPAVSGGPRKLHSSPTPRLGGIAIFLGFFLTQLVWSFETPLKGPLLASIAVFTVGLLDDLYPLSAKLRLLIQVACAAAAVYWGGFALREVAVTSALYFTIPYWLGFLLAVFIIVGAINATNMVDGLDGLAGGIVLISITLLSFVHFLRTEDTSFILYLTIPMVGAILGFLRYNTYPASIFMGDSGSNWLGFMTGVFMLIVLSNQSFLGANDRGLRAAGFAVQSATHIPLISAILALAIPVFDTACVMLSRLRDGLSPMAADRRHFHHTLLRLGLSHSQSVSAVYFLALLAGVLGIIPILFEHYSFAWVPYAVAASLLLVIPLSINVKRPPIQKLLIRRVILRQTRGFQINQGVHHWERLNRYILYGILLACPSFAGVVKPQVGYAAILGILFIVIVGLLRTDQSDFFDSLALSLGAIVLLVTNNQNVMMIELNGQRLSIQHLYNASFIFLFLSTALLFLLTIKRRYFLFTPLDFLLVGIPMIMLLVPEPYRGQYKLDIICLRSLVVFMCLRTMIKRRRQAIYRIRVVVVAALIFVALGGVWGLRMVY